MKGTDKFIKAIEEYLGSFAKKDPNFRAKLDAADESGEKSIEKCVGYILNVVQKSGRIAWKEEEVYGLAVHYYEEPNEKLGTIEDMDNFNGTIVGDYELTEEDKEAAKQEAIATYQQSLIRQMQESRLNQPTKKGKIEDAKASSTQMSLFD